VSRNCGEEQFLNNEVPSKHETDQIIGHAENFLETLATLVTRLQD
jgi:hypothetical protein